MKTLDKEVQIAIINEAGSTYRNHLLGCSKQHADNAAAISAAESAAQKFIDLCEKNLAGSMRVGSLSQLSSNYTNFTQSAVVYLYQWAKSVPKLPGACLYDWSTAALSMGSKPNGWASTKQEGSQGDTLYVVSMGITNSGQHTLTILDWEGADVSGIAHQGT